MIPLLIIGLVLLCICSCGMSLPLGISSSVLFGDLRGSGTYREAQEHFNQKKMK